jgi:enoyl-CoA hydratase
MDMQTLTEKLVARRDGAIGWIVFNNPQKHNAVSLEMWEALPVVLDQFAKDAQIRVVILKGEGEKAFISGADISQFKEKRGSAEAVQSYNAASDRASRALNEFPKPLIAMIRGYCIGGGLGVASACDLRIASDNSRFGVPAAKLGLGYRY